jgi:hypothetical protein
MKINSFSILFVGFLLMARIHYIIIKNMALDVAQLHLVVFWLLMKWA